MNVFLFLALGYGQVKIETLSELFEFTSFKSPEWENFRMGSFFKFGQAVPEIFEF